MRPLRFRAWDATERKMWTPAAISADGKAMIDQFGVQTTDDDPVMQSTGLTDKNGVEIFEGDVVLWPDTESEYVDVGVGEVKVAETSVNSWGSVVFRDGAFGVESPGGEAAKEGWYSLKEFLYDYCPPEDIEVIGNIYENPDLLPKQ